MSKPTKSIGRTTLNFYYKEVFDELEKTLGETFTNLTPRIKSGYANVVTKHSRITKTNQHRKDPESFYMPDSEVESYFNDARDFRCVNDTGYYLLPSKKEKGAYTLQRKEEKNSTYHNPTNWLISTVMAANGVNGKPGWANGFKLSDSLQKVANKVESLKDKELTLINHKQQTITEVVGGNGGALFATESKLNPTNNLNLEVIIDVQTLQEHRNLIMEIGNEVWKSEQEEYKQSKHKLLSNVERRLVAGKWVAEDGAREFTIGGVKYNSLPTYIKSFIDSNISMNSLHNRFNEIDKLLELTKGKQTPSIPIIYTEASTGRYTAKAGMLQSYNKSVRYAALRGCYEYDLEAAHQNILLQLLNTLSNQDLTEDEINGIDAIYDYTKYKNDTRLNLLIDVDCEDISQIKEALQALTYGAHLVNNPFQAITNIFDNDKAVIDRFNNHTFTRRYKEGFNTAHRLLVGNDKEITNEVGITKPRETKSKDLAHILQGYERQVLDAIIKHSNKEDIALLLHDCVVFYKQQDPSYLSDIVKTETGFSLEFSEEIY